MILVAVVMYARLARLSWKQNSWTGDPDGVTLFLLPVREVLLALAAGWIYAGAKRREEDAQGPLFRLS